MKPDLSALIASLAEIIARLKFVHHELQRLEKQKRKVHEIRPGVICNR